MASMPGSFRGERLKISLDDDDDDNPTSSRPGLAHSSMSFSGGRLPEIPTSSMAPPRHTNNIDHVPSPLTSTITTSPHPQKCTHFPSTCQLSTISFLLSPCIASTPWITEDLLLSHGVTTFIRSPSEWKGSPAPAKIRARVVLVESRRKDATAAFLKQVAEAKLRRKCDSEVQYVPAYDWRVLEAVTREEARRKRAGERWCGGLDVKGGGKGGGVWDKYWVGLIGQP